MEDKNFSPEDSQILMYQSEDGQFRLDVRLKDESVWLTQTMMAQLFGVDRSVISRHLKNIFDEGELDKTVVCAEIAHTTQHGAIQGKTQKQISQFYNLDAIISVGYRVNSHRATQFRIWATKILTEYIKKGFVLNDDKLKGESNLRYFDELQSRLRLIRLSEKVFYQKVKDIYKTSIDYDPKAEQTIEFFKVVQNKLLWAVSRQTAAELVTRRANAELPFMGMTSIDKKNPCAITKQDAVTAKNYLNEDEIKSLGLLVEQYLAFAEAQAQQHVQMTMSDWIQRLDMLLTFNGRELLQNAGKISHEMARQTSEVQLNIFRQNLLEKEHEESIIELENDLKTLQSGEQDKDADI